MSQINPINKIPVFFSPEEAIKATISRFEQLNQTIMHSNDRNTQKIQLIHDLVAKLAQFEDLEPTEKVDNYKSIRELVNMYCNVIYPELRERLSPLLTNVDAINNVYRSNKF